MTPPGRTRRTPPCRSTRRRNDRQPPNTVRRRVTSAMEPTPTPSGTVEDHRLSAPHSMHRAAPASRAYGRYAVGLPADPGHRRLTAVRPNNGGQRPQKDKQQNTADLTGPAPSGMTTKRRRSAMRRLLQLAPLHREGSPNQSYGTVAREFSSDGVSVGVCVLQKVRPTGWSSVDQ
jgi:hypothetical protein